MKISPCLLTIASQAGWCSAGSTARGKSRTIRMFWPLAYLVALVRAFLFAKLPLRFGGKNFGLAVLNFLIMGGIFYMIS